MAKVSLIVPVYNADDWFPECLASIRAQTYGDVELIVIDDPEGTGAGCARNRGLEKATGDYIAFCDADDYLEPDAIERMVHVATGVEMVIGSFRKFGDFDQRVSHHTETMNRRKVAKYCLGNLRSPRSNQMLSGCWAKLYRRELVGRFPALTTAEDMAFNYDYLKRCENVRFLNSIVYHNRKRKGSLSTTFNENDKPGLFGFLLALRYVRTFLEEFYEDEEIENAIDNSKVYHTMLYYMRICQQTGKPMRDVLMELYP